MADDKPKHPHLRLVRDDEPPGYAVDGDHQIFFGTPEVTVPDYFVIIQEGRVIGRVKATFDLEDLPVDYHLSAFNWIQQGRVRLAALPERERRGSEPAPPREPTDGGVIRKIRAFLGLES